MKIGLGSNFLLISQSPLRHEHSDSTFLRNHLSTTLGVLLYQKKTSEICGPRRSYLKIETASASVVIVTEPASQSMNRTMDFLLSRKSQSQLDSFVSSQLVRRSEIEPVQATSSQAALLENAFLEDVRQSRIDYMTGNMRKTRNRG